MLTDAQLPALSSAIQAETDPAFVALLDSGATGAMAEWLNGVASPAFICWRTRVPLDEIMQNGFDWTQVDNATVGQARIWEWLFNNTTKTINPSKANVRAGIAECWKGNAQKLAVQAAVLGHCKRSATRGERIFATGTGTDVTPGNFGFEGAISDGDVVRALSA